MYTENDEGIDLNSSGYQNYASFVPDETTFVGNRTKSIHLPHKLDLSTLGTPKTKSSSQNRKKISPIKVNSDSRVNKSFNWTENSTKKKNYNDSVNLEEIQNSFEEMMSQRKNSNGSVTSDRASSVCSSSSGQSQKSLFVQVTRAKKLVDQQRRRQVEQEEENSRRRKVEDVREKRKNAPRAKDDGIVEDSDWNIGEGGGLEEDETDDDDDTRPPSSQPSLVSEPDAIELRRRAPGASSSDLMYSQGQRNKKGHRHQSQKTSSGYRSTATNTTGVNLSDTQLYELYQKRQPKLRPQKPQKSKSTTLQVHETHDDDEIHEDDDPDKTIVELAFQDYSPEMETPILRSDAARDVSGWSLGSNHQIERARDAPPHTSTRIAPHRSVSLNNLMTNIGGRARAGAKMITTTEHRSGGFDGFAPGALRHSMSVVQVSPEKLRELEHHNKTHPIPNLAQFVIKPSTRSIFPLPLMDIDEISGKGLRKDEKSSQRHFSGQTISNQIHGERPAPRAPTVPQKSSRGADRPTTASAAKKVGFEPKKSLKPPAKTQPPYCSVTSSDGTAYSITTVSQQLLGTVKSLHPDWLQMTRRLLEGPNDENVLHEFRRHLILEMEHLEEKWKRNRNEQPFEHPDDPWTRIAMIRRMVERLKEAEHHSVSRIQQIKMIQTALLST